MLVLIAFLSSFALLDNQYPQTSGKEHKTMDTSDWQRQQARRSVCGAARAMFNMIRGGHADLDQFKLILDS
jgi:hypothetical protein